MAPMLRLSVSDVSDVLDVVACLRARVKEKRRWDDSQRLRSVE
jgi:hypothetical protein